MHSAPAARAAPRSTAEQIEIQHAVSMNEAFSLLNHGVPHRHVASRLCMAIGTLSLIADSSGNLLLTRQAERLLHCPDAALAEHFAGVPRALRQRDLHILQQVLRQHAHEPAADLRPACAAAGMAPEAAAHLLDADGRLRADRVASLPPAQQHALQPVAPSSSAAIVAAAPAAAFAARPAAAGPRLHPGATATPSVHPGILSHATTMVQAQAMLAAGHTAQVVARQFHMDPTTLAKTLDARGRLLFTPQAERLLDCPDGALAERLAAMPRALRQGDLRALSRLLSQPARAPLPNLREACEAAGVAFQALDFLFDAEGHLRAHRLSALPLEQRRALEDALPAVRTQTRPAAAGTVEIIEIDDSSDSDEPGDAGDASDADSLHGSGELDDFATSLEALLESPAPSPLPTLSTPSVLGKRPAPDASTSAGSRHKPDAEPPAELAWGSTRPRTRAGAGAAPVPPEPLRWGAQGMRSHRPQPAQPQQLQPRFAGLPEAAEALRIAPQAGEDDEDFGLPDPGPPTPGDWAFLDSAPSWFMTGTRQRPPSSSAARPAAHPAADPAASASQDHADWLDGLDGLDGLPSSWPNSPPDPNKNPP